LGPRPHRWGDNQGMQTHTFPAYQRDVIGTEVLVPGFFGYRNGVHGQCWRCWYFPEWYYDDFWPAILMRMRGKPLGPNKWVRDSYWDKSGQKSLKSIKNQSEIEPKRPKEGRRGASGGQTRSKWIQNRAEGGPKGGQGGPKGSPRRTQGGPKGAREGSRGAQGEPQGAQGGPKGGPRGHQGRPRGAQGGPRDAAGLRNTALCD